MRRLLVALLLAGCGAAPGTSRDRPDHPFDPGAVKPGGYVSGSGTGSGSETTPSPPPDCEPSGRRCPHEFVYYGKGGERSVEVRGSFDNWGAGQAMALSSGAWRATVEISFLDRSVYKFRIVDS